MADTENIEAGFWSRWQTFIAAAPGSMSISSGYRSPQQQAKLYELYKAGKGNLAAPPGKSNHNHGLAMDISFSSPAVQQWAHSNAAAYGLAFPIGSEPWHIEPLGLRSNQYDPGAAHGMGQSSRGGVTVPVDNLAQRAQSIQSMILGTPSVIGEGQMGPSQVFQEGAGTEGTGTEGAGVGTVSGSGIDTLVQAGRAAGFEGEDLVTMVAIGMAESGGNPASQNLTHPDHSIGLWQINQLAHRGQFGSDEALMDPVTNANAARSLHSQRGFQPWSAYTNGAYQQFMGQAQTAVSQAGGGQ